MTWAMAFAQLFAGLAGIACGGLLLMVAWGIGWRFIAPLLIATAILCILAVVLV